MKMVPYGKEVLDEEDGIYHHYPVDIKEFIDGKDYMDIGDECWPEIKTTLIELFDKPPKSKLLSSHREFIFKAGIGSGKSYLISVLFAYIIYRLMCLKNPQRYYGLAKGSKITLLNMSKNALQARKVVFGELTGRIENSPWFQHNGLPDPEIRSELRFPKGIQVMPGNSQETFPLGFHIFAANLDEAAFFTETAVHDVAEEIYHALNRRITSRFRDGGMIGITSSPRYEQDFIERKCKEADKAKHILAKVIETWNTKPEDIIDIYEGRVFETIHPITKEMVKIPLRYKYDFESNPDKAWRDFGAIPSLVLEPYFKQFNLVEQCIDPDLQDPITKDGVLEEWFVGNKAYNYYIHIDLALVSDACGIAMAHREGDIVIVDLIHRVIGSHEKEIDISEVRNFVLGIHARGFPLGKVTYDQFQSASSIQELNKHNIESEKLSVDSSLSPYETLKEMCYTNKVKFYENQKLFEELQQLELVKGKKVDHPPKGSKDVADAVCGAVFNAVSESASRLVKLKIL